MTFNEGALVFLDQRVIYVKWTFWSTFTKCIMCMMIHKIYVLCMMNIQILFFWLNSIKIEKKKKFLSQILKFKSNKTIFDCSILISKVSRKNFQLRLVKSNTFSSFLSIILLTNLKITQSSCSTQTSSLLPHKKHKSLKLNLQNATN